MLSEGYTSVSRLINTEPSKLLYLRLSEPIASEIVDTMINNAFRKSEPSGTPHWGCSLAKVGVFQTLDSLILGT